MITFNLKKEWFEKIKAGEKTHEYREVKPYWTNILNKRLFGSSLSKIQFIFYCQGKINNLWITPYLDTICFMNGMVAEDKKPRLYARMRSIHIKDGLETDLKINAPVYDIEFELIKE